MIRRFDFKVFIASLVSIVLFSAYLPFSGEGDVEVDVYAYSNTTEWLTHVIYDVMEMVNYLIAWLVANYFAHQRKYNREFKYSFLVRKATITMVFFSVLRLVDYFLFRGKYEYILFTVLVLDLATYFAHYIYMLKKGQTPFYMDVALECVYKKIKELLSHVVRFLRSIWVVFYLLLIWFTL